jgi:hypothetical protein
VAMMPAAVAGAVVAGAEHL